MGLELRTELHVINSEKKIYKVASVRELDSKIYSLVYNLELVAGYDYVNPDENDIQGFVSAENFVDDVQLECFTVYPLDETLGERLEEEDYKVINIKEYQIH